MQKLKRIVLEVWKSDKGHMIGPKIALVQKQDPGPILTFFR